MGWIDWGTVKASLRVMGLGMAGIMATALAFWVAIVGLRRAFPPSGAGDQEADGAGPHPEGDR